MATREPFAQKLGHGSSKHDTRLKLHTLDPDDVTPEPLDPREYQAVRTARRPPRLRIRCGITGQARSLPYTALLDIVEDNNFGSCFALVFHHQVVHVTGRNLGAVADAISDHGAAVIRVFDGKEFDLPAEGVPVIEKVEFDGLGK